jgi:hypothetical protein
VCSQWIYGLYRVREGLSLACVLSGSVVYTGRVKEVRIVWWVKWDPNPERDCASFGREADQGILDPREGLGLLRWRVGIGDPIGREI